MDAFKKFISFLIVAIIFAVGGYFIGHGVTNNQAANLYGADIKINAWKEGGTCYIIDSYGSRPGKFDRDGNCLRDKKAVAVKNDVPVAIKTDTQKPLQQGSSSNIDYVGIFMSGDYCSFLRDGNTIRGTVNRYGDCIANLTVATNNLTAVINTGFTAEAAQVLNGLPGLTLDADGLNSALRRTLSSGSVPPGGIIVYHANDGCTWVAAATHGVKVWCDTIKAATSTGIAALTQALSGMPFLKLDADGLNADLRKALSSGSVPPGGIIVYHANDGCIWVAASTHGVKAWCDTTMQTSATSGR